MKHGSTSRLVKPDGKIDRRLIAVEAHRQFEQAQRIGLDWTFARCLAFTWHKAKGQRSLSAFTRLEAEAKRVCAECF